MHKREKIEKYAPDLLSKIASKEVSRAEAYRIACERASHDHPRAEATFARVSKSSSPLAKWIWDPVTKAADSAPEFHPERLVAPLNALRDQTKLKAGTEANGTAPDQRHQRVVVCDACDLYSPEISNEWISAVHEACSKYPQWQY
jgi:hypothetical protein